MKPGRYADTWCGIVIKERTPIADNAEEATCVQCLANAAENALVPRCPVCNSGYFFIDQGFRRCSSCGHPSK